jgi:hypothetical protein
MVFSTEVTRRALFSTGPSWHKGMKAQYGYAQRNTPCFMIINIFIFKPN